MNIAYYLQNRVLPLCQRSLKFIMTISRDREALEGFLNCQRLGNVPQSLLSFVVFSFDFDKADSLWSSVTKTYQSESVQAGISYNNKSAEHFNGLRQQRHISVAQAHISAVDQQDVHHPSEFRNGLHNLSESMMIEGPLFLVLCVTSLQRRGRGIPRVSCTRN